MSLSLKNKIKTYIDPDGRGKMWKQNLQSNDPVKFDTGVFNYKK